MGFFTKNKETKKDMPAMKFPEFPKYESEISHDDFSQIKSAVSTPDIGSSMSRPSLDIPDYNDQNSYREEQEVHRTEKTLFIKVDKYKGVMRDIDHIKSKLEELEKVMSKLDSIKREEDEELSKWHSDVETLKERISSIDKTLFES